MKILLSLAIVIIFGISNIGFAEDLDSITMTNAKHILMPFVGYQTMNGEQSGYTLSLHIPGSAQTLFQDIDVNQSKTFEKDQKFSVIGGIYRYRIHSLFYTDLSFGMILNKKTVAYPITFQILNQSSRFDIPVSRSNTLYSGLDLVSKMPYTLKLLGTVLNANARFGGGLSWRSIKNTGRNAYQGLDGTYLNLEINDAEQLPYFRGGVDFSLFRSEMLVLNVTVLYTQYMPMESDGDPFGGIGWQFSLFPMWR